MKTFLKIARQMGPRYVAYRVRHALETKLGLLERRHPPAPDRALPLLSLEGFRQNPPAFFFRSGETELARVPDAALTARADALLAGRFEYFSAEHYPADPEAPWHTHPITGACFPAVHWSRVPDFDPALGDIKYIWEPSRFSHLYTLIRDDYHNGRDHGAFVLGQIADWLAANPTNVGPNYKCSQEMSLRVLNWTFALHFYREHASLTPELWEALQRNVYWSLHHVYHHIDFSRIAVRNNHAVTETSMLWLGGLLYAWLPDVGEWSQAGKRMLEAELAYQCYADGTYIQHSHNYQRVVVQLLTWGLRLGEVHADRLSETAYARGRAMLHYLRTVTQANGELPNYGPNDGALFFPLATQDYRDYRPQLDAFARVLGEASVPGGSREEGDWLGLPRADTYQSAADGPSSFPVGGVYTFRQNGLFVFIKCQAYRDRPSQADNLHLDLWVDGVNLLRDQGTFRYNASEADRKYFFGTASHNTVMLDGLDQMTKGLRFVWLDWTREAAGAWAEDGSHFSGEIEAFRPLGPRVRHRREVWIYPAERRLRVEDRIVGKPPATQLTQLWHPNPEAPQSLSFEAVAATGERLPRVTLPGAYSGHYGVKVPVEDTAFRTHTDGIATVITWH